MTQKQVITYWYESAARNRIAAEDNFKLGHHDWCLFLWQLTLEKVLKGIITKKGITPPPTHNLKKLLIISGIRAEKFHDLLDEISSFNLEARYDDYKQSFYQKADVKFTQKWKNHCEEIYQWLLNQ